MGYDTYTTFKQNHLKKFAVILAASSSIQSNVCVHSGGLQRDLCDLCTAADSHRNAVVNCSRSDVDHGVLRNTVKSTEVRIHKERQECEREELTSMSVT